MGLRSPKEIGIFFAVFKWCALLSWLSFASLGTEMVRDYDALGFTEDNIVEDIEASIRLPGQSMPTEGRLLLVEPHWMGLGPRLGARRAVFLTGELSQWTQVPLNPDIESALRKTLIEYRIGVIKEASKDKRGILRKLELAIGYRESRIEVPPNFDKMGEQFPAFQRTPIFTQERAHFEIISNPHREEIAVDSLKDVTKYVPQSQTGLGALCARISRRLIGAFRP